MSFLKGRIFALVVLLVGCALLFCVVVLLNLSVATDHMYHALIKDPPRTAPVGNRIVSPADGTVLYVRRITNGVIPMVVKEGVTVPVIEHMKSKPVRPFGNGYLVGIYMNTHGVHVNRVPNDGIVVAQHIYNGPHLDMTEAETTVILSQLVPGRMTAKKLLGMEPFALEDKADYILKSARETLVIRDTEGYYLYVVRIADYYVGKIVTWVRLKEEVQRGQKLGMIVWGSQTDLFIEDRPGLNLQVKAGAYVYGAETTIATYE